jgi:hypothetical protein
MKQQNNLYMTEEDICNDYIYMFNTKAGVCGGCMENNFLLPFFFLLSFVPFTLCFSSWVVAKFIYMPYMKALENYLEVEEVEQVEEVEEVEEEEKEPLYEEKYPINKELDENKDIDTEKNSVFEETPDGSVFMKYNRENEGFDWWGDNKQVAYKYLETVARKYVNVFNCTSLYIDRQEDINRQIEREKEEEERAKIKAEDKEEDPDSDDDLFVKFKPNQQMQPKKKGEKVARHANKYKNCGKISDFEILLKPKKKVDTSKKMDFSSWKTMFNK